MTDFVLLAFGLCVLILGSHWLLKSLKGLSIYFKLKPLFLSIVVLGFVSSSPEFFVSLNATMKELSSVAIGNILGSNIINILLVLSLGGLFCNFKKNVQIARLDMPVLMGSVLLLGLTVLDKVLGFLDGFIFLTLFLFYMVLLFKKRKADEGLSYNLAPNFSVFKSFVFLVIGFVFLFAGSSLAVDSAVRLVEVFSLDQKFAGVFILSLSTSLPELSAVLQAIFKKEQDMALGTIIGSNIFNTLFVLGSMALLKPLSFFMLGSTALLKPLSFLGLYYDYFFMSVVTFILFVSLLFFKKIPKFIFVGFICLYFIYIGFLIEASFSL